jgi:hypothetical protein
LVPVPETFARALDPHDLAIVKLRVARPKDIALVRRLIDAGLLDPPALRARIGLLNAPAEALPRILDTLRSIAGS